MIRIDQLWLAVEPLDMRAGAERLLARVVQVFGSAQAHHGYLFANARATRIKLLVHDGFGVWCVVCGAALERRALRVAATGAWRSRTDDLDPATIRRPGARLALAAAGTNEGHHTHVMQA